MDWNKNLSYCVVTEQKEKIGRDLLHLTNFSWSYPNPGQSIPKMMTIPGDIVWILNVPQSLCDEGFL